MPIASIDTNRENDMDPKIVEQVAGKIAENINGFSESVTATAVLALNQYTSAALVFSVIWFVVLCVSIVGMIILIKAAIRLDKANDDNSAVCTICAVLVGLFALASFAAAMGNLHHYITPITSMLNM